MIISCIDVITFLQVVVMLVIILTVFALCWLPFQISLLYAEHRPDQHISVSIGCTARYTSSDLLYILWS